MTDDLREAWDALDAVTTATFAAAREPSFTADMVQKAVNPARRVLDTVIRSHERALLAVAQPPLRHGAEVETAFRKMAAEIDDPLGGILRSLFGEIDDTRAALSVRDAVIARLRRQIEFALPSLPRNNDPLTEEHLAAIRLRWATGPEKYQNDADALIAEVLRLRAALRASGKEL